MTLPTRISFYNTGSHLEGLDSEIFTSQDQRLIYQPDSYYTSSLSPEIRPSRSFLAALLSIWQLPLAMNNALFC